MKIGDIVNKINFWPICEIKTIPGGSFQFFFTVLGFARLFFPLILHLIICIWGLYLFSTKELCHLMERRDWVY